MKASPWDNRSKEPSIVVKLLQFAKLGRPSVTFTMNEIAEESVSIKIREN